MSDKRKRLIIRSVILLIFVVALGFTLFQLLHTTKTVAIGDQAPNFELTDLNGKKVQLKDFRGKTVMINFWASWCDPCKEEVPYINQAYESVKDKNIVILGVNYAESHFAVQNFVEQYHMKFPVLLDENKDVVNAYGVGPIPTTFFIDKNGKVIDKVVGTMPNKGFILQKLLKTQP